MEHPVKMDDLSQISFHLEKHGFLSIRALRILARVNSQAPDLVPKLKKMRHEELDPTNFRIQNDSISFKVTKLHVTKYKSIWKLWNHEKLERHFDQAACGFFQPLAGSRRLPGRNQREFELWAASHVWPVGQPLEDFTGCGSRDGRDQNSLFQGCGYPNWSLAKMIFHPKMVNLEKWALDGFGGSEYASTFGPFGSFGLRACASGGHRSLSLCIQVLALVCSESIMIGILFNFKLRFWLENWWRIYLIWFLFWSSMILMLEFY